MGTQSTSKKKRAREPSMALTAQNKKTLECILGLCGHGPEAKTCLYWTKVVDNDDPALVQYKLIEKLIKEVTK